MQYEVELKFRLADFDTVQVNLLRLGAEEVASVTHVDRYFNHPSRDFRSTDEAFRIRSVGDANFVTYKGAVVGQVAKTRHEIEVGFENGAESATRFQEMVQLLGFRFVLEVRKTRQSLSLMRNGRNFELALDEVPRLGRFLEIELLAEAGQRETAEAAVWEVAKSLGLSVAEPRSYLDLLLNN